MLTKEECELALEEYDFRSERPLPHEYKLLRRLINEHFELLKKHQELQDENARLSFDKIVNNIEDMNYNLWLENPPLKFEELEEGMWVWDSKYKEYKKVYMYDEFEECYWLSVIDAECDEPIYEENFEENRFYRKQVEE